MMQIARPSGLPDGIPAGGSINEQITELEVKTSSQQMKDSKHNKSDAANAMRHRAASLMFTGPGHVQKSLFTTNSAALAKTCQPPTTLLLLACFIHMDEQVLCVYERERERGVRIGWGRHSLERISLCLSISVLVARGGACNLQRQHRRGEGTLALQGKLHPYWQPRFRNWQCHNHGDVWLS